MTISSFTYRYQTPAQDLRTLQVTPGDWLVPGKIIRLSGANGAGKTTLLQLLSGLLKPTEGTFDYDPNDLFFLPHQPGLKLSLSAWDNLDYWAALNMIKVKHYLKELMEIIDIFELKNILKVSLYQLSAGQQRRAALLRLGLVGQRKLWFLDEPETSLDQRSIDQLGQIVTRHADQGGTIIWASHQNLPIRTDAEINL
jgi:heme exporter protein A